MLSQGWIFSLMLGQIKQQQSYQLRCDRPFTEYTLAYPDSYVDYLKRLNQVFIRRFESTSPGSLHNPHRRLNLPVWANWLFGTGQ